jgi:LytS/YehU family sensor histidine kinase
VENGIKHGVSKLPTGGKVSLTTRSADGNLEIEITNSGELADNALYEAKGFGIANTKQRLHLLYGERASFNLINENNHVKATVIIPIEGALK